MTYPRIIAAVLAAVLGLPTPFVVAQPDTEKITPDWIEKAYERGVKCHAAGDDAGAESAFLKSLYLIERHFKGEHRTARPYLAFADLLTEHREVCHALVCVKRALGCNDFPRDDGDRRRFVAELLVLACNPGIERKKSSVEVYGDELPAELPERLREALIALRRSDAKDADSARVLVDFVADAATRRMEQKRSPLTALALLVAGLERLGADLESEPPAGLRRPVHRLRILFRGCFPEAEQAYAGDSRSEGRRDNRPVEGRSPALAYRLGEVYRLRWRVEPDRDDFARSAAGLFASVLKSRPDHRAAARGLAEIQFRTGKKSAAADTFQNLVSRLLVPSVAWDGPPRVPPAPRCYLASTLLDAFEGDAVGLRGFDDPPDPAMVEFRRAVDGRIAASYLEHRRFHPFDRVICWSDVEVRQENNVGFWLMEQWELRRAEQHLRRSLYLAEHVVKPRESMPVAHQNLGHLHYLQGDYERAIECYRKSYREDSKNAVSANNLGAVMGIFGSIALDLHLIHEGLEYYKRAVELQPDYVYARASKDFMEKVYATWYGYLEQGDRSPFRVVSFGNSFLFSAKSISESPDPRHLQAMQILDAGIRAMPSEAEMTRLFGEGDAVAKTPDGEISIHETLADMRKTFDSCRKGAVKKYLALRREKGADHPAINFMLGEAYRIGWRRLGEARDQDHAIECYETTLAGVPDHAAAAAGLAELLRSAGGKDRRAIEMLDRVVGELLKPVRPWSGEPELPAAPRARDAFDLAVRVAKESGREGAWGDFLRRTIDRVLAVQIAHAQALRKGRDPEAWNNLGYLEVKASELLVKREHLDQALIHVDRALELDPGRVGPSLNKIQVLQRLGRHEDAEALRAAMEKKYPGDSRFAPSPSRRRL